MLIVEIEAGKQVLFIHFLWRERIYRENWGLHCDGNTTGCLTSVGAEKRDVGDEKGKGMKQKTNRMLSTGARTRIVGGD